MGKVVAVIVTYNRCELLKENIECLLNQTYPLDILVVDNNSTDGTYESLKDFIEEDKIKYFNTGANLGGAGGFQCGIKKAVIAGYEYLWVMDDDCMPNPDALQKLMDADSELEGKYGFLSSKVLWKDGSICTMNVQRRKLTKPVKKFDKPLIPVVMASFVSFFVKSVTVQELGLPIKEFFIWTDDWEYTRRISRKYPCYVVTESTVVHKSNSNIGANIANDSPDRLDRYKYLYRNDVYLYRREGFRGFCYETARLTAHYLRILFKAKDNKRKRIKQLVSGTKEGFRFHPSIEYVTANETGDGLEERTD